VFITVYLVGLRYGPAVVYSGMPWKALASPEVRMFMKIAPPVRETPLRLFQAAFAAASRDAWKSVADRRLCGPQHFSCNLDGYYRAAR